MSKKKLDWEDLKVLSGYRDTHSIWLKPKLEWLTKKNPSYADAINEGARLPHDWTFDVWVKEEMKREKEQLEREEREGNELF